ncbi:MAG: hypothetical protein JHC61_06865 [Burkholderiaceae bacterium]|nr:hypothetical protein [Burkholderiaceae bacterium]
MLARSARWTRLGAVCVLTFALAACAVRGGVATSVGTDEYEVSYNAGLRNISWVELKNITLRAAEEHCTSLGRKLVDPRVTSNGATGLIPKKATARFTCQPVEAPK